MLSFVFKLTKLWTFLKIKISARHNAGNHGLCIGVMKFYCKLGINHATMQCLTLWANTASFQRTLFIHNGLCVVLLPVSNGRWVFFVLSTKFILWLCKCLSFKELCPRRLQCPVSKWLIEDWIGGLTFGFFLDIHHFDLIMQGAMALFLIICFMNSNRYPGRNSGYWVIQDRMPFHGVPYMDWKANTKALRYCFIHLCFCTLHIVTSNDTVSWPQYRPMCILAEWTLTCWL